MIAASAFGWALLAHLLGIVGFFAAHGVSAAVAFQLRRERDPARIRALLDLSKRARPTGYVSIVLMGVAGAVLALDRGVLGAWYVFEQRGWLIWSTVLFVALLVVAVPLAIPYYKKVRLAVAQGSEADPAALDLLLRSPRPLVIAAVELGGMLTIIYLMVLRPF